MVLNHYSEKIVDIVFVVAVMLMFGLYFFPNETLNIVGAASASIKPAINVLGALLSLIKDLLLRIA